MLRLTAPGRLHAARVIVGCRAPARCSSSADPSAAGDSSRALEALRQYIAEHSHADAEPRQIHVRALSKFYQQHPSAKECLGKGAITAAASGLRWVTRGRGQSFIQLHPDAPSAPVVASPRAELPSLSDVLFPEVPSDRQVDTTLRRLRAHLEGRFSHLSPIRIEEHALAGSYDQYSDGNLARFRSLVNRATIEARGGPLGLRWVRSRKKNYVEVVEVARPEESAARPDVNVEGGGSDGCSGALKETLLALQGFLASQPGHLLRAGEFKRFYDSVRVRRRPRKADIQAVGEQFGLCWTDEGVTLFDKRDTKSDDQSISDSNSNSNSDSNSNSTDNVSVENVEALIATPTPPEADALLALRRYIEVKGSPSADQNRRISVGGLLQFYVHHPEHKQTLGQKPDLPSFIEEHGLKFRLRMSEQHIEARSRHADKQPTSPEVPYATTPAELMVGKRRFLRFDDSGRAVLSRSPTEDREAIAEKSADDVSHLSDIDELAAVLPAHIKGAFSACLEYSRVVELVLDVDRAPLVRSFSAEEQGRPGDGLRPVRSRLLDTAAVTRDDLQAICTHPSMGKFNSGNRAGLGKTLHRISRKLNRHNETIGLTMRVGRMVEGSTKLITDIVKSKRSVLLLGVPGVGKTSVLREYARILSEMGSRVEIVDTSNEIAGDSDAPHRSVGQARRMMVRHRDEQHMVMIEAVQNHMPQCIIVDEIGTRAEAQAAADIAQRGVQIIATAHGTELRHLLQSPELDRLIGGVHTVIVGDEQMKSKRLASKSVRERMGVPVFDTVVELHSPQRWVVYDDVSAAVDLALDGRPVPHQVRTIEMASGRMQITKEKT